MTYRRIGFLIGISVLYAAVMSVIIWYLNGPWWAGAIIGVWIAQSVYYPFSED